MQSRQALSSLTLGAIGVVFGDIGTSPLYALKEIFNGHHPIPVTPDNILGILSMIVWSIVLLVTLKYVLVIMRADNRGEGGSLALLALATECAKNPRLAWVVTLLGIFAAALFYGDSMITPAISVLSAVEGLELVTPALKPYVIPLTLAILTGLFFIQKRGTGRRTEAVARHDPARGNHAGFCHRSRLSIQHIGQRAWRVRHVRRIAKPGRVCL